MRSKRDKGGAVFRSLPPDEVASRLGLSTVLNVSTPVLSPLRARVNRLSRRERQWLVAWCTTVSETMNGARGDVGVRNRVKWAKLVVVLIPSTLPLVKGIMADETLGESRFSLFCSLDYNVGLGSPALRDSLERIVTTFLLTTKTDRGFSAWKAADHIGGYWPVRRGFRSLSTVLLNGRAAGKRAALYGLESVYRRGGKSRRAAIKSLITTAMADEPNRTTRFREEMVLQQMEAGRMPPW